MKQTPQIETSTMETENAVHELLGTSYRLLRRLRAEIYSGELSWTQLSVLSRLEATGELTTAELARHLVMTPQSMGTALTGMQKLGLIGSRPHATDGRQQLFSLTEAGINARSQARLQKQDWLTEVLERFSPAERQTLIDAAELLKRLEKP